MTRSIAAAVLFAALAASTAPPALAQSCGDRESLVRRLDSVHKEKLVAAGLHDPQHLVELWATADGSTWTLLFSRADGYSCIMGAGSGWSSLAGPGEMAGIEG